MAGLRRPAPVGHLRREAPEQVHPSDNDIRALVPTPARVASPSTSLAIGLRYESTSSQSSRRRRSAARAEALDHSALARLRRHLAEWVPLSAGA